MTDPTVARKPGHTAAGPASHRTPPHGQSPGTEVAAAVETLIPLLRGGGWLVLSGAGLSTESGIPDYRGPEGERRVNPMTASDLRATSEARRRYWARSFVGWPRFAAAVPNAGHHAVTQLQQAGVLGPIITQNVDGLHDRAGARNVIELHGNLARVVCMTCGSRYARTLVDEWLRVANPDFDRSAPGQLNPDGDVAISQESVDRFRLALCPRCGQDTLKPDVVMFGESVAKHVVAECFSLVEASRGVLVLGSSLAVMSGYRFVRRAAAAALPVISISRGWSRGAAEITTKIETPLGLTLEALTTRLASN